MAAVSQIAVALGRRYNETGLIFNGAEEAEFIRQVAVITAIVGVGNSLVKEREVVGIEDHPLIVRFADRFAVTDLA